MAINLKDVKKTSKEKSKFYQVDEREEKENETLTPWKSFKHEEDLIDRIKSRDSVTKRIDRKKFSKNEKKEQSKICDVSPAYKKLAKKNISDKMLQDTIAKKAKEIFSRITS